MISATKILEKKFKLSLHNTDIKTEFTAGITTYLTLSYIFFVQPAILSAAGMDFGAVFTATCISSAVSTIMMGYMANYPIALAPAMGHNFFFAFTVCGTVANGGMGYSWQTALGANFIAGLIFLALSFTKLRSTLIKAIPESLKYSISAGIGLLITIIGLEWSGLVVKNPGTMISLGNLKDPKVLISIFGVLLISIMLARGVRGAIIIGITACTILSFLCGFIKFEGIVSTPPSLESTFMKFDLLNLFKSRDFISVILLFLFLDIFDTMGTLVGVCKKAKLMENGTLAKGKEAFLSDASGTLIGTILGTSTVTSYIESATGIAEGGRTGLANVFTAVMMLLTLFFYPAIKMIGGGVKISGGGTLYPTLAPALIILGSFMMSSVKEINWDDPSEAIPAFLTMIIMPVSFSITDGIAFGFISYSIINVCSSKKKTLSSLIYILSIGFILRYMFL